MIAGHLARQPILDADLNIFGYEILYRPTSDASEAGQLNDIEAGTLALLYFLKQNTDESNVLKSKHIFIKVGANILSNEVLLLINDPEHIVLELQRDVFEKNNKIESTIITLKERGFKIALESFAISSAFSKYLKYADFFKIDSRTRNNKSLSMLIELALSSTKAITIAEKIEDADTFDDSKKQGIKLFQGYYFLYPQNFATETPQSDFNVLLSVMQKIANDENFESVSKEIKKDPVLSFKVIRYANCLQGEDLVQINSIMEALNIIGRERLNKWLGLSLTHGKRTGGLLTKHALIRAKLMDLLAQENNKSNKFRDAVFLVGLFSLSDLYMNISKGEVFEQVFLNEDIFGGVLREKSSPYTDYLNLAIAVETTDVKTIKELLIKLNISTQILSEAHLKAISWVERNELMSGDVKCKL